MRSWSNAKRKQDYRSRPVCGLRRRIERQRLREKQGLHRRLSHPRPGDGCPSLPRDKSTGTPRSLSRGAAQAPNRHDRRVLIPSHPRPPPFARRPSTHKIVPGTDMCELPTERTINNRFCYLREIEGMETMKGIFRFVISLFIFQAACATFGRVNWR